ncbi:MAG: VWA domain-containing protein [Janthinobacterium lividum]
MRFRATWFRTGFIGLSMGVCGASLAAQTTPQNNVPDAPKPQTLPQLNGITPTAPAVPNAPVPNAPTPNATSSDAGTSNSGAAQGSTSSASSASDNADAGSNADRGTPGATGGPPPAAHASDIRVVVNFVEIPFTVKDSKGALVPGLTLRDVRVFENGLQQQIRLFSVDPTQLSVAIVVDQSVTFDTMKKVNASLEALQSSFTPYDEVAIYTYNNGVKEQTGFSGAQSARVGFALQRSKGEGREQNMGLGGGPLEQTTVSNNHPVDPQTNRNSPAGVLLQQVPREYHTLNDAILTSAVQVAKAGRGRRRVIYVISDGKEYGSQAKEKEVIQYLQRNQIAVFATLVGDSSIPGEDFLDKFHLPFTMRDNALPRYSSATGGDYEAAFRPRVIENSFAKLTEEVRTQYLVGYYSHEPFIDGKYRPVEVKVMRPSLDVIAKKGYYPSMNAFPSGPSGAPSRTTTPTSGAQSNTSPAATGTSTGTGTGAPTTP